jgi:uncharacterized membrane protein (UPF0127 family)
MDSKEIKSIPLFENYCKQTTIDDKVIDCSIGEKSIKLKVASTPKSHSIGYQNAKDEPSDEDGILFVYPNECLSTFWMKNVNFPLDILFFNSNKELVGNQTMPTNSYPKTFKCNIPFQYAVETKAGWYDRNGNRDIKLSI